MTLGPLTGAVSSQIVTEEFEGYLGTVGHRTLSAMAKGSLTAGLTRRAGAKAGHSDPGFFPSSRGEIASSQTFQLR